MAVAKYWDNNQKKYIPVGYAPYMNNYIEYGVKFTIGDSSPERSRVIRINGVIQSWDINYTPNYNGEINDNPFDKIDLFSPEVWYDQFGNKFARFSKFYVGRQIIGSEEYHWVCKAPVQSYYRLPKSFKDYKADGTEWDYVDIGCYKASEESVSNQTYLASKPDQFPAHNNSRTNFYNKAKALNERAGDTGKEKYLILTASDYCEILTPLVEIMLGTVNTQSKYEGVTGLDGTERNIVAMSADGDNTILYYSANPGSGHKTGCVIALNSSSDSSNYRSVVADGTVTGSVSGNTFVASDDGSTYYSVTVEGSVDSSVSKTQARPIKTGSTDGLLATRGTFGASGSNGTKDFKLFNVEGLWGNIWDSILNVVMYDHVPYVCKDLNNWVDTSSPNTNTNYEEVGYTCANENGYVKEMGFDNNHADVQFVTKVGGTSNTFYSDYYYQSSGARTVFAGGYLASWSVAGLFCFHLNGGVGGSYWQLGARLSHRALKGV